MSSEDVAQLQSTVPDSAPPPRPIRGLGFRTQVGIILTAVFVASIGVIFFSVEVLRRQIISSIPDAMAFEADSAFRHAFFSQGLMLFVAATLLLILMYLLIGGLIARPLRLLSRALTAYAKDGTRIPLEVPSGAAKEIKVLDAAFDSFITRVEISHKRDMETSRVKSDFISTAAHQFRTPLTGIRWALEALEKEDLTEDQKALVKSAVDKSHDLVGVVGTLLDISSIESGKYHYKFESVDMAALAADIARDFTELASERQVSLFYQGGELPIPPVRADRDRIKWVLNNLVENAIRYTPSGGTVRLTASTGGGRVFVKVKDTGIGIPPEDRGNIFERFFRSGNAIAKENAGSGLGLYIARTIATDHGGDLSFVPNEAGPGTTFILSLPLA
jgi:signal transduction histidine kinase